MSLVTVHYLSCMVNQASTVVPNAVAGEEATFTFVNLPVETEVDIIWGDGAETTHTTDESGDLEVAHTFAYAGTFTVQVVVDGKVVEEFIISVPGMVFVPDGIVAEVESDDFDFVLEPSEDYVVFWGDGTTSDITTDADGLAADTHTYAAGGTFALRVTGEFNAQVATGHVEVVDSFVLTFDDESTEPISFSAEDSDIEDALVALVTIGADNVSVSTEEGYFAVEFIGDLAATDVPEMTAAATTGDVVVDTDTEGVEAVSPEDEVQTLTVDATGGTFTLTFEDQTTSAIAFDANSAAVQSALLALSNLDTGDVVVTGDGPHVITFGGTLAATDVDIITTDATSLTGGASTATVVESTPGVEEVEAVNEVQTITLP